MPFDACGSHDGEKEQKMVRSAQLTVLSQARKGGMDEIE